MAIAVGASLVLPLGEEIGETLRNVSVNIFMNPNNLALLLKKGAMYSLGIGFVDPAERVGLSFLNILVQRLAAIDTIIFPIIFWFQVLRGRMGRFRQELYPVLVGYLIYISGYTFAGIVYGEEYGLHYRALMPFQYIISLYLLASLKKGTYPNNSYFLTRFHMSFIETDCDKAHVVEEY